MIVDQIKNKSEVDGHIADLPYLESLYLGILL